MRIVMYFVGYRLLVYSTVYTNFAPSFRSLKIFNINVCLSQVTVSYRVLGGDTVYTYGTVHAWSEPAAHWLRTVRLKRKVEVWPVPTYLVTIYVA